MANSDYLSVPLNVENPEDEIRMLVLTGGERIEAIQCTLKAVSLLDCPAFEALSYTWGDQSQRHEIICNEQPFSIGRNLYTAHQELRPKSGTRAIWIDAVCINQQDKDEKGIQVNLMCRIYQLCFCVVIWLGQGRPDTMLIAPFVKDLLKASERQSSKKVERSYKQLSAKEILEYGIPPLHNRGYSALRHFIRSSWCERVWIIQEVAVASNAQLQCGIHTMTMKDVVLAMSYIYLLQIEDLLGFSSPGRFCTIWVERISIKQNRPRPLLTLVIRHWLASATLPEDKIYALCGLATDFGIPQGLNFKINYRRAPHEVFTDFTTAVLKQDRNLNILSALSSYHPRRSVLLPSWVPDWTVWNSNTLVFQTPEPGVNDPAAIHFTATKDSEATPVLGNMGRDLKLNGMILDEIVAVGGVMLTSESTIQLLSRLNSWERVAKLRPTNIFRSAKKLWPIYADTISMGNCAGYLKGNPWEQYLEWDKKLSQLSALYNGSGGVDPDFLESDVSDHEFFKALSVGFNRVLVRTKKGHLGLVVGCAEIWDRIALLKGGKLPLVIRWGGTSWKVVGDGYVNGIMAGEAFKEKKCQDMWFA